MPRTSRLSLAFVIVLAGLLPARLAAEGFVCAGYPASAPVSAGPAVKPTESRDNPVSPRGRVHALVIFAQFADEASHGESVPSYVGYLLDPDLPGSLTHFYHAMSFGEFTLEGTVLPRRYTSESPAAAYLSGDADQPGDFGRFAQEILRKVDPEVDFARFDNDGPDGIPDSGDDDGVVDYVFLCVRSTPDGFLPRRATGIAALGVSWYVTQDAGADGEPVGISGGSFLGGTTSRGAICREGSMAQTVGAMAHELGHGLGLPDLYDLDYREPGEDSAGIGRWGLMGWGAEGWNGNDGPNPFCAWSREQLGWISPDNGRLVEVVEETSGLVVADLHTGGSTVKIPLRAESADGVLFAQEYLLLEHRTRSGTFYNRSLPAEGLLVWHVRPQAAIGPERGNDDEHNKALDLVCADGLYRDAGYPLGQVPDPEEGSDNLDFWAHDATYRAAHGGNLGDATDPFDGVRYTRLSPATNPAIDSGGLLSAASTALDLGLRRQGEATMVDVTPPRWAGVVDGEVHWTGLVLVDGDVRVPPLASLVLHPPARVLFAGSDRLRAGRDPEHCELVIEGDLRLEGGGPHEQVVLEATHARERWYGLVMDPADSSRAWMPDGRYVLRHAASGVVFAQAPAGAEGVVRTCVLNDAPAGATAGNGDGRLSPGESFEVVVALDNWSLAAYEDVRVTVGWSMPAVYPTWEASSTTYLSDHVSSGPFSLYPGRHGRVCPQLTLSPEAADGELVELVVSVHAASPARLWQDTLSVTTAGRRPEYEVAFEVPRHPIRDGSVTVPLDQATHVRAAIQGEVEGADLVVWSPPQGALVAEIPMERQASAGDGQVFEAAFLPPEETLYQLYVRLRGPAGTVVLSEASLRLRATPRGEPTPALVFLGDPYSPEEQNALREMIAEVLAERGSGARFELAAPADGAFYQPLLEERGADGSLVVWLGATMGPEALTAFRGFLERGGRLLLISAGFSAGSESDAFLEESLYSRSGDRRSSPLRTLYSSPPLVFEVGHTQLELALPAEPVLLNDGHRAAGLRLDTGSYRVVYLPFHLQGLPQEVRRELIASSLRFLQQSVVQGAVLDLGRDDQVGAVLGVPADGPTAVRARVQGAVGAADLVVSSFPERQVLAVLPMQQVARPGPVRLFETAFQPPSPDHCHLSLRLSSPAGDTLFAGTGQRVLGLFGDRPALLFLGERYTKYNVAMWEGLVQEELDKVGLPASVVRQANAHGELYENLLGQYLRETELVVWLGNTLDERGQAAFRAFLDRGGRLLLISPEFHTSPGSSAFLEEILKARIQPAIARRSYHSTSHLRDAIELTMRPGSLLALTAPSVPLLVDEAKQVAGMGLDNRRYRVVYLPFDLFVAAEAVRPSLIESALAFLVQGASQEPHLQVDAVIAPQVTMGLEPAAPRVVVANLGPWDSAGFRLGYQVLLGEEVLAAAAQEETDLAALTEREIALPAWKPSGAGVFHIRFGLGAPGQEELAYGPVRRLYVADVGPAFAALALPDTGSSAYGAGFFDYDNDGDLDLYLVCSPANQLLRNEGAGFTQQAEAADVADAGQGRGLAVGDYDGDGDLDLYVVNGERMARGFHPNTFYRNEGDGSFVDVTAELDADPTTTTPLGDGGPGRSAGFFDCDLDGDLDLYLVNDKEVANRLYRNEATGFAEGAAAVGLADVGHGGGLAIGDYDGDGDGDLFVANVEEGSRLYRNEGGTFVDVHQQMGLHLAGGEVAAVFGDYDNDADLDLFISSQRSPQAASSSFPGLNQLFRNNAGARFQEVGLGAVRHPGDRTASAAFFDHDNDGDLDLVTTASRGFDGGHGDELYHNLGGSLVPVGHLLGLQPEGGGYGLTFSDYDQDGDVDWVVAERGRSRLYRNQSNQNHWLQVDLQGAERNPDGLGARVELAVEGGRQYREVQSAYGYCSQVQPRVHFGLGASEQVDALRVKWPDGQETVQTNVATDRLLTVLRPSPVIAVLDTAGVLPTSFELGPNYPNPFNPTTVIPFSVPETPGAGHPLVTIAIYDLLGQKVRTLVSEEPAPGAYRASWNGRDDQGRTLATGAYLCRLRAGGHTQARKLLLIR